MTLRIPTELDSDLIEEFQSLMKKHLNKSVSGVYAQHEALKLIEMYALLIDASPEYRKSKRNLKNGNLID